MVMGWWFYVASGGSSNFAGLRLSPTLPCAGQVFCPLTRHSTAWMTENVLYTIIRLNQITVYNVCVCVYVHNRANISLGPQHLVLSALEVYLKGVHLQGSLKKRQTLKCFAESKLKFCFPGSKCCLCKQGFASANLSMQVAVAVNVAVIPTVRKTTCEIRVHIQIPLWLMLFRVEAIAG